MSILPQHRTRTSNVINLLFLSLLFTLTAAVMPAAAATTVRWTTSPTASVTGYRVYYGTASGVYLQAAGAGIDNGNSASYTFADGVLQDDRRYFVAVTAYDEVGRESAYSTEYIREVDPALDTDSDGVPNGQELTNGTNPYDASDNIPVVNAGSDTVLYVNPGVIQLTGSATDPNGDRLSYLWSQISGPVNVILSNSTSLIASFMAIEDGSYQFSFSANDSKIIITDYLNIFVNNTAPSANAGADQKVLTNSLVSLHGTGGDANNDTLSYSWQRVSGPAVTLNNALTAHPSFTPASSGIYEFGLKVNDGTNDSPLDTVTILVENPNSIPTAEAGNNQSVTLGATVTIDGTGSSDADGVNQKPTGYKWILKSYPAGFNTSVLTAGMLSSASFSFIPGVSGVYVFSLTVSDGVSTSLADEVTITVQDPPYVVPVANAGSDQCVNAGELVTLGGGGSTVSDGMPISYTWKQTAGTPVTLSGTTLMTVTFTPAFAGTYEFELVVSDGKNRSLPDTVVICVNAVNSMPFANAGADQQVYTGDLVSLDGSASSDPDGDTLTFFWSQTGGPNAILSGNSEVSPVFTPDVAGIYTFELKTFDGEIYSLPDTITVTANSIANSLPVAQAGEDQAVHTGTEVILDGSASSDPDGDPLSYAWIQVQGPTVILTGANEAAARFTPSGEGLYKFEFVVNDGFTNSQPDVINISVSSKIMTKKKVNRGRGDILQTSATSMEVGLTIPAGAMTEEDTLVSIGESDIVPSFDSRTEMIGKVVSINPPGAILGSPVEVKFTIGLENTDKDVIVMQYNENTQEWTEVPVTDKRNGYVIINQSTFNRLAVGVKQGDTPRKRVAGGCGYIKPAGPSGPGSGGGMQLGLMLGIVMLSTLFRRLVLQRVKA